MRVTNPAAAVCSNSMEGMITHHVLGGGMSKVSITIAVSPVGARPAEGFVSITPLFSLNCEVPPTPSYLTQLNTSVAYGNWSVYDVDYDVGPLPILGCQLPAFVEIRFGIPLGFDIRIAAIRMAGIGEPMPLALAEIPSIRDIPQPASSMWPVWVAAGVGVLVVLFLLALLWYCCGKPLLCARSVRPPSPSISYPLPLLPSACIRHVALPCLSVGLLRACTWETQSAQACWVPVRCCPAAASQLLTAAHTRACRIAGIDVIAAPDGGAAVQDKNDPIARKGAAFQHAHGRTGSNAHTMIAVDTMYPDMPPSMDDESRYTDKHGLYHGGMLSTKQSRDMAVVPAHGGRQDAVVDLSVPGQQRMHEYQPNLALSAPRQGQDIFDTWCAAVPSLWTCVPCACAPATIADPATTARAPRSCNDAPATMLLQRPPISSAARALRSHGIMYNNAQCSCATRVCNLCALLVSQPRCSAGSTRASATRAATTSTRRALWTRRRRRSPPTRRCRRRATRRRRTSRQSSASPRSSACASTSSRACRRSTRRSLGGSTTPTAT